MLFRSRTFKQVGDPDLVVVGNSKITTDLYLPSVASAFGLEPRRVVPLSIAGSGIAVWYAALERHVFRTGYQPDHILVYGPPVRLLEAEPRSVRERAKLEAELDGIPEAEANEIRMRAGVDPRWERAVANAEHLHDDLLDGWRDRILHAFLGMDAADVTPALESVFAVGSTGESHGALPVAAAEPVQYPLSEPEDSVLAALVERAHAEGIQVVVALAPVGSSLAATEADPVTPERLAALVRWLEANDVGWIDVRDTTSDADLGDGMHMTSVGRERFRVPFAAALAEQQQERGPVRPALPPRLDPPPDLRREGTPTPPQFEARDGKTPCTGAFNAAHFRAATPSLLPELPDLPSPFVLTVAGVPLPSASSLGDLTTGCIGKYFHHNGQLSFSRPSEDAPLPEVAWRMEPQIGRAHV